MNIGFLGLGTMGLPIARNMARAGTGLVVWSRSDPATEAMRAVGARVAETRREAVNRRPA